MAVCSPISQVRKLVCGNKSGQATLGAGRLGMPSSLAASKLSRVCQVRKPPRMEVSEVTGSRCWGWSLVFSSCRVGELFAPLAASTWPKRGQIVVVVSNFPLAKASSLEDRWFYGNEPGLCVLLESISVQAVEGRKAIGVSPSWLCLVAFLTPGPPRHHHRLDLR